MRDPIFRLFISSSFADFHHEREALHERVFPELEAYCRARGARFDVVDLRWGISPEAQADLRTLKICLTEVERCARTGLAPHFVALLGDRYGWEPAPVEIKATDWREMIRRRRGDGKGADRILLRAFYSLDRNANPPVWILRRDAYAAADGQARAALLAAVRRLALAIGLAPEKHPTIFASATHQEIAAGLLCEDDPQPGVAYLRSIKGLPLAPEGAPYVDVADGAFDAAAYGRQAALKARLVASLPSERVRKVDAAWAGGDISRDHIDGFCEQFLADHKALIDQSLAAANVPEAARNPHEAFAAERARLFVGRRTPLSKILRYAVSQRPAPEAAKPPSKPTAPSSRREARRAFPPLVIEGAGGIGKSSLMAMAAQRTREAQPHATVITRFIGAVAGSEDLTSLLTDLTGTIAAAYGAPRPGVPNGAEDATAAFGAALGIASDTRPLVLFIDALDQLAPADQLRLLDWLPDTLPAGVRIIVSTRPGPIAAEGHRRFPRASLQLAGMSGGDSGIMLKRMLADTGRTLTGQQREQIRRANPGLPLWTQLAVEEARHWRSDEPGRPLERTVEGLIDARIQDLGRPANHGEALVRDALGAIAAARFGLSDSELADALSDARAPEVWAEFRARSFHAWDQPVLPAIVWLRLRADLSAYLVESLTDGCLTYRFFHREFADIVAQLTLSGDVGRAMHARLADVFAEATGTAEDGAVGRGETPGPLWLACDATGVQDSRALRRVMEQPWQLAAAGNVNALETLLNDVAFVAAKCAANRVSDLMQDIAALESSSTALATAESLQEEQRKEDQRAAQSRVPASAQAAPRSTAATSAAWRARLRSWRAMLNHADKHWPAHRVLFQLLLEADPSSVPERAAALNLLARNSPNWTVLASAKPQRYVPAPAEEVPAIRDLAGLAALSKGYLALWSHTGGLLIFDRRSATLVDRLELATAKAAHARLPSLADRYGTVKAVFDVPKQPAYGAPTGLALEEYGLRLSWPWSGCLNVKRTAQHTGAQAGDLPGDQLAGQRANPATGVSEIILGKGEITLVGESADEIYFCCDHRILIMGKAGLASLSIGIYAFGGACIEGLELEGADGGWTHERFNSVVFISSDDCLTLGFDSSSGYSESVILEAWKISETGIARIGWGVTDNYLDLPIWFICGLSDGSVILTSSNDRSFKWLPPFDGENVVEMVRKEENVGDWVVSEGTLTFQPTAPGIRVVFETKGHFGDRAGDHYACPGITYIDADSHSAPAFFTGFETTDADGALIRWHCDVRANWIFAREGGDYLVFKNSGAVRVGRWQR